MGRGGFGIWDLERGRRGVIQHSVSELGLGFNDPCMVKGGSMEYGALGWIDTLSGIFEVLT